MRRATNRPEVPDAAGSKRSVPASPPSLCVCCVCVCVCARARSRESERACTCSRMSERPLQPAVARAGVCVCVRACVRACMCACVCARARE